MSADRIQFRSNTAEVAEVNSSLRDWQLPAGERCFRRRILPDAKQGNPGAAQNMCRTVIMKENDVVLPGPNLVFVPCACLHRDF